MKYLTVALDKLKGRRGENGSGIMTSNRKPYENETFYVPFVLHPHDYGDKYGKYFQPVYSTIEELRKYYPEPMEYITIMQKSVVNDG